MDGSNLHSRNDSNKLAPKVEGPFEVVRELEPGNTSSPTLKATYTLRVGTSNTLRIAHYQVTPPIHLSKEERLL